MPRCLDQRTEMKFRSPKDVPLDFPIITTRIVMSEEGEVNIYSIMTQPTTEHPNLWRDRRYEDEEALHYATGIRLNGELYVVDHIDFNFREDFKMNPKRVISAVSNHLERVNQIRQDGGERTKNRIYDPTRE